MIDVLPPQMSLKKLGFESKILVKYARMLNCPVTGHPKTPSHEISVWWRYRRGVQHRPGVCCKNFGFKANIFPRHLRCLNSHEDCILKGEQKDSIFAVRKSCVPARGEGSQIGSFSDAKMSTTFGAPFTSQDSLIISRLPSRKKCHFRAIRNARMLNCPDI